MADYNQSLGFPMGLRIHNLGGMTDLMESNQGLGATESGQTGGAATYLDTLKYYEELNAYADDMGTGQIIWADSQQPTLAEDVAAKEVVTEAAMA